MISRTFVGMVIAMATISTTCGGESSGKVHRCAGAGQWFPANRAELRRAVNGYLDAAKFEMPKGRVVAVVSPHAGYAYAGPIAGYSYRAVRGNSYDRVLILAFSHRYPVRGLSVLDVDAYETPLGSIPVDRPCVKALLKEDIVRSVPEAHRAEWSDENQLPFLQVALKPGWKLVSVFVGYDMTEAQFDAAAKVLRPYVTDKTLIVVSSDFTHISNADSKQQSKWDLDAAKLLVAKDHDGFLRYVRADRETQGSICGSQPLALLLKMLDKNVQGHLLKHATSGDMTGNYSYSVGYCSIIYTAPNENPSGGGTKLQSDKILEPEEEQTLLHLARATLTEWVKSHSQNVDLSKFNLTPTLRRNAGAFVTLHKQGQLRGCIGYIQPIKPLYETVMDNARNAATNDPRFPPVTAAELGKIDIEISVMSPLRKIKSVDEIVIGKHGLVIKKGVNQGVFLPQVPVEQGWDLNQYLEGICRKAFLPRGAWKKGAELQVFTAQVFGEKESHPE